MQSNRIFFRKWLSWRAALVALAVFSALTLATRPAAAFTFTPEKVLTDAINDTGTDPNCEQPLGPTQPGFSGWNIDELGLWYDRPNDRLYVGVSMANDVIAGDVEDNGDPGTTDPCLLNQGGIDFADLDSAEAIDVVFDLDNNTNYDIIVGNAFPNNINTTIVATYTGGPGSNVPLAPGFLYGAPVTATVNVVNNPSASAKDYEFSIDNFSALMGLTPSDALSFCVASIAGSIDAGFGEDGAPNVGCYPVLFTPPLAVSLRQATATGSGSWALGAAAGVLALAGVAVWRSRRATGR